MNELHDRFTSWLAHGADGDPSRDVAVHASACERCLRSAAAMDALAAIDPGLAEAPPVVAAPGVGWGASPSVRAFAGTLAGLSLVAVLTLGAMNALRPALTDQAAVGSSPSPAGEVLGDQGGPATASASADDASPSERESPTSAPTASPVATPAGPPLLPPVTPPPPAPTITTAPTPVPTSAITPSPTPLVTAAATPTTTPIPTPTADPTVAPSALPSATPVARPTPSPPTTP